MVSDRAPVNQLEYCARRIAEEPEQRAIALTAIDTQPGLPMACVGAQKGVTKHAVYELRQFIFGIGRTYGII